MIGRLVTKTKFCVGRQMFTSYLWRLIRGRIGHARQRNKPDSPWNVQGRVVFRCRLMYKGAEPPEPPRTESQNRYVHLGVLRVEGSLRSST
jgi:hypothetical protein